MKQLTATFSTLALAALVAAPAFADDHKYEITGSVGQTFYAQDRDLDDAATYGVGLGYVLNPNWTLETWFNSTETDVEHSDIEVDSSHYRLDALRNFAGGNGWQPFLAFGVGQQRFDAEDVPDADETLINFGGGVKRFLTENISMRGDLRAFHSLDEEDTDFGASLGVAYNFGGSPKAAPAVAEPAPVAAPAPVDSDGDGVFDDKDQCPDTPRELKVDEVGCPIELSKPVTIDMKVLFDTDSAVVKEQYYGEIQRVADFAKQYLNTAIVVEGHTDSTASNAYNLSLSERRAQAVEKVLEEQFGLAADRVTSVGYGEERPIATNDTVDGRATNRRVVGEISTVVKTMKTK